MMTESGEDTSKSVHVAMRTEGLKVINRFNEKLSALKIDRFHLYI